MRSVVGRDLDHHLDQLTHAGGLRPEARSDTDRPCRELLGPAHPRVVAVALIGDEVEHLLDPSIDDDLTHDADHSS